MRQADSIRSRAPIPFDTLCAFSTAVIIVVAARRGGRAAPHQPWSLTPVNHHHPRARPATATPLRHQSNPRASALRCANRPLCRSRASSSSTGPLIEIGQLTTEHGGGCHGAHPSGPFLTLRSGQRQNTGHRFDTAAMSSSAVGLLLVLENDPCRRSRQEHCGRRRSVGAGSRGTG